MLGHEAVAYECCRNTMEKFRQNEGLPTKQMPRLVSSDDEVLGGVRRAGRTLWRALTSRKVDRQPQSYAARQGSVAK
jgi:hypothetical protein